MKEVRPTSSRVLLALFNIITPVRDLAFLDLFAGTGRVGLKALELEARSVTFVEVLRARAAAIEKNVPALHADKATVLSLELRRAVTWLAKREATFDVIFADPPYSEGWGTELMTINGLGSLLAPDGIIVVEHSSREELQSCGWDVYDVRNYGETTLTFLRKAQKESQA